MTEWILVCCASLFAGFVDAIVGGGGLILIPTLLSAFPGAPVATLFGTNKGAAICGTSWAALQYARQVPIHWRVTLPAASIAALGSALGAYLLTLAASAQLRKAVPLILAGVLVYTLMKKDLGQRESRRFQGNREVLISCGIGLAIGLYDGFFGPGTGSLLVFLFVRVLGYDFLQASASAKLVNTATNLAAISMFAAKGHIWLGYAAAMGVANIAGSWLGTRLALKGGAGFVRSVFITVVTLLIAKTGSDVLFSAIG